MVEEATPAKPPPQIAGVTGIGATPITMNEPQPNVIPWLEITALPPFQMFAAERMRNTSGRDSMEHARDYVRDMGGGKEVLDQYAAWHYAKGYWPNETPLGQVKE